MLNSDSKDRPDENGRPGLKILAFLDGRPGHEKQTRGVIRALGGLTSVAVTPVPVRPASLWQAVVNWLRYAGILPVRAATGAGPADLVIGTGSHTHLPMLLYKKKYPTRVVTCMTPDRLIRGRIDLCLVPRHDNTPSAANIFYTSGPPNHVVRGKHHDGGAGLILVGGVDPKSHRWQTDVVTGQIEAILQKQGDLTWTLSSSPRTPEDTCVALERLVARYPEASFLRSADTPAGWVEAQYARCDKVWVTADSVSMVFEALTAGCRVGVLPVAWKVPDNKFVRGLEDLHRRGMITRFPDWVQGNATMQRGGMLDEAARCAREILRRWWPERLQ